MHLTLTRVMQVQLAIMSFCNKALLVETPLAVFLFEPVYALYHLFYFVAHSEFSVTHELICI